MKTVLVHERPMSGAKQSRPAQRRPNLAARVGRWSAAHWKTATFGWLALVLLAFAVGSQVGTKQADPTKAGPGESGRMDRILDAGFKVPASESVLIQSRSTSSRHAGLRRRRQGRRDPPRDGGRRAERPLAARSGQRRPDRKGQTCRARRVRDPRRQHQGDGQARPDPQERRRRPTRPSGLLRRRVRRCERGQSGQHRLRARPQERGRVLDPAHADHPRRRLRRARGRGHPAAARAHGGVRDLRAGGAAESPAPACTRSVRRRAAGRARGRCRLLDVLPPARTRGTGRRAERARRARGRRCHLRPLGAHLRPDGDGGDGRLVPDRRRHVRLLRVRDDDRRRVRDGRLADRSPRAALEARRPRRPAARSARRPPAPRQRRKPHLGSDRRPRPAPAAALRRDRRRTAAGARRPGPPAADGDTRSGHLPQVARRGEDLQPHAAGVPGHGAAGLRRRQGPGRQCAGRPPGDRPAQGGGTRHRPRTRADHGRHEQQPHDREHHRPDPRQGNRRPVERQPGGPARGRSFPGPSARSRTSSRASPGSPPNGKTRRTS